VGAFPTDRTPEGICDMGGNTWEWTLSRPEDYPYNSTDSRNDLAGTGDRVLRGGAASNSKRLARCTYRNWVAPDSRVPFIGFRVVVSELPRALPAPSEEATT
jgi:sulfatase modifying factor 1